MYPVARLAFSSLGALGRPPLGIDGISEIRFRCRPWDLDMFFEMNNGRILTLYDLGRFDLSIRMGLFGVLRKNRWGLAVAGSSVRYRKRIKLFDKVMIRSQILGTDEKWFFAGQSMWVKGQPCSSVLVRTCVTSSGRSVPTRTVLREIGADQWPTPLPDWAENWRQADETRPWPPRP